MSQPKTIAIIGGVAGGASAAARLRRLDDSAEIVVLERSGYVSFANCGLPYHLSSAITERDDLLLQTPESLSARFRLDVRVNTEVVRIKPSIRQLTVHNLATDQTYLISYDVLVLSPGAAAIIPPIPGAERGQVLRDIEDLDRLIAKADLSRTAVVVGGGFIGLEAAENLRLRGLTVTVVELGDQLLAPLDPEMASPILTELRQHEVRIELKASVVRVLNDAVELADGRTLPADLVLFAIGVRPDNSLARDAGLRIGPRGGIWVDTDMRTSNPDIWAVGDAVEKSDFLDGAAMLTPLANIANRQGRRAADSIMGHATTVSATQGTAIVKVFELAAAITGWSEKRLQAAGRDFLAIHTHPTAHAAYYPGAPSLALKLLVNPANGSILGAQAVGYGGVDKRIDVLATAIRGELNAVNLIDLELAYAPPFSSAKDPVNVLGYIAENRLGGEELSVDWSQVERLALAGWSLLDVREAAELDSGSIPGSVNIPLDDLRPLVPTLAGRKWIVYCAQGQRAHIAAALLRGHGVDARNLDGGWLTWAASPAAQRLSHLPVERVRLVDTDKPRHRDRFQA